MGFLTGLKEFGALVDQANEEKKIEKTKTKWLGQVVVDGQSVKIRFVNELDEDSPSYSPDRGLAIVAYEHVDPDNFRHKCVCTMDTEGRCYGCAKADAGVQGWWKKMRFYINVLVDNGVDEPFVATWSMAVKRNPTFDTLREYSKEVGGISNLTWRLKRNGKGTDTTWALIPTAPDALPFDWDGIKFNPLESVLYQVPFDKQAAWFGANEEKSSGAEDDVPW
jgi:hypothetical protein